MSNLKTDYVCYPDEDFIEKNGKIRELKVTITLAEYRKLIQDVAALEIKNEALMEENKKLKETNKNLSNALMVCNGGKLLKGISTAFSDVFKPDGEENEDGEETEEADNEPDT